jgi:hypothetical protein
MVLESSGLSLLCMEAAQVERDNLCISIDTPSGLTGYTHLEGRQHYILCSILHRPLIFRKNILIYLLELIFSASHSVLKDLLLQT